jgi:hypothetical protein
MFDIASRSLATALCGGALARGLPARGGPPGIRDAFPLSTIRYDPQ